MTKPVFGWFPDIDAEMTCAPKVTVAQFGDGYEARVRKGINSASQKWSLTFERDRATVIAAEAFLRARGGAEAFTWTNPLNEAGTYVCREWSTSHPAGTLKLRCTFEQVFES